MIYGIGMRMTITLLLEPADHAVSVANRRPLDYKRLPGTPIAPSLY